jgi:hypothetical protein
VQYCGQPQGEHTGGEGGTDRRGQIDDALLAAGTRSPASVDPRAAASVGKFCNDARILFRISFFKVAVSFAVYSYLIGAAVPRFKATINRRDLC